MAFCFRRDIEDHVIDFTMPQANSVTIHNAIEWILYICSLETERKTWYTSQLIHLGLQSDSSGQDVEPNRLENQPATRDPHYTAFQKHLPYPSQSEDAHSGGVPRDGTVGSGPSRARCWGDMSNLHRFLRRPGPPSMLRQARLLSRLRDCVAQLAG